MTWSLTDDPVAYRTAAWSFLAAEPERYSVLLTVLSALIRTGPDAYGNQGPLFGWWPASGQVRAAVLQTPPRPMLITSLPGDAAEQLAAALPGRAAVPPGVNGSEPDADAFASAWQRQTGAHGHIVARHRLYRLGKLEWPKRRPAGVPRVAVGQDIDTVRALYAAFADETGQDGAPGVAEDRLAAGQIMLWEVAGEAVALAGFSEIIAGAARIGPVYTPPGLRARGYGGGVTAAVSERAERYGASSVILFTDLANPTSNELYARLGYRPVEDRVVLVFDD